MNIATQKILIKARNFFNAPDLSRETLEACYFRLPEKIDVSWKRDGNFIIGKVTAGDNEFTTQGKSVDDFIKMVNDSVYTVFDVPFDYVNAIEKLKAYDPPIEARKKLEDLGIKEQKLSLVKKDKRTVRLA